VNQLRLGTEHDYYNSGVLLMDLERARQEIKASELFRYVEQHRIALVLPDQDVLNALYGNKILPLEDVLWNYDARNYSNYLLRSGGVCNLPWVMEHTAILHFCGKEKPWKPKYTRRFGILYQHYAQLNRKAAEISAFPICHIPCQTA
ncbi:MAG TPA: glycosyltransferase family 8 protein, partial [Candidatus Aphodomonas merdavium]|nr:glycosyltransferase family 8 protein [Candidatus Aphodomonas merdavium]